MQVAFLQKLTLAALLVYVAAPIQSVQAQGSGTNGFALATNSFTFAPNAVIADNNLSGASFVQWLNSPITSLGSVQVNINMSGFGGAGFNGDMYAYLSFTNSQGQSGFTVLLNRSGRSAGNPLGYGDDGFNVTFDDLAPNGDIHQYQNVTDPSGGTLTGTWQPDGRNIHPYNSLDSTPRGAGLSTFTGLNPNGAWTLFLADAATGNELVLNSWGMTLTGVVPEPSTYALAGLAVCMLLGLRKRA